MSAVTAKLHTPAELTYHGTASNGVAVFSSDSKSRPGTKNWTYLDTANMQVACECQAKSGTCWHCDLAATAWAMAQVAPFVASRADDELVAVGTTAAEAVAAQRHTATDLAVMWAARVEYAKRGRATVATLTAERGLLLPCPDCGEPTRNRYLCTGCVEDLVTERTRHFPALALAA